MNDHCGYIDILKNAGEIVISGHVNPDGDCIGACFAAAMAISQLGKNPVVLLEEIPQRFEIIPGREFLYTGDTDTLHPDVFIALDCGDTSRFGRFAAVYERARVTYCVDHHKTNDGFADYNYIEPDASSTCEIVYKLIEPHVKIDKRIAAALYAGIVDDTGGFCHQSTSAYVHEIAGKLIGAGIPFSEIYNEIKNTRTMKEIEGLRLALDNMTIKGALAYSYVSGAQMDEHGILYTDFEAIAEFLLNIKGVRLAFFAYEKPSGTKISLRSKRADVALIAAALGGGGHRFAAGVSLDKPVKHAAELVLNEINSGLSEGI